jgi:hypothetical protein
VPCSSRGLCFRDRALVYKQTHICHLSLRVCSGAPTNTTYCSYRVSQQIVKFCHTQEVNAVAHAQGDRLASSHLLGDTHRNKCSPGTLFQSTGRRGGVVELEMRHHAHRPRLEVFIHRSHTIDTTLPVFRIIRRVRLRPLAVIRSLDRALLPSSRSLPMPRP